MPRAPRIQYEGAIYHVLARGNRREPIVFDDEDRRTFVRTLASACQKSGWEIFAWVLMDNHYHLALRTPGANLVEGMQWFQNTFTRRINTRHKLWGHLFGGRYKAILVEDESLGGEAYQSDYLRVLIDYIHLNPARAGWIDPTEQSILDYPWSSVAQGYAKPPTKRPGWVNVSEGLDLFGEKDVTRGRKRFVERLDQTISVEERDRLGLVEWDDQSLQSTLRRGWYWGSQTFREQLLDRFGAEAKQKRNRDDHSSPMIREFDEREAETIVKAATKHFGVPEAEWMEDRRGDRRKAAVAWAIFQQTNMPHRWIAERLQMRSPANVSQTVRNFDKIEDKKLPKEISTWKNAYFVD